MDKITYIPGIVNIIHIGISDAKSASGFSSENRIAASTIRQLKLEVSSAADWQKFGFWRNTFEIPNVMAKPDRGSKSAAKTAYMFITSKTYIFM